MASHQPLLLRHCYRLLGSFAEAEELTQDTLEKAWRARSRMPAGEGLKRWLVAIATNGCLNVLHRRRRRTLPQFDREPAGTEFNFDDIAPHRFITLAPDARLALSPADGLETRETVALAFVAMLQRLPPRQRAVLLMKDVLGWPAEAIAQALQLSVPSVTSALNRARKTLALRPAPVAEEPSPSTVRAFVRAWETRDLDRLISLLRDDLTLAMPPYPIWFHGHDGLRRFVRSPRFAAFWASGIRVQVTRANGLPAFAFFQPTEQRSFTLHSIMVARFRGQQAAELTVFVGPGYFSGFDRTVLPGSIVITSKGRT